jgi:hypothetical protein
MPQVRFPASDERRRGELRLTDDGMTFIPDQRGMTLDGWHLSWSEIAGIERVAGPGGKLRVHYDDCLHFQAVRIHESLRQFFALVDAFVATRSVRAA